MVQVAAQSTSNARSAPDTNEQRVPAPATSGKKIVIHSAGGYEKLKVEKFEVPAIGPNDVLVEVRAAGINFADTSIRLGLYASAKELVGWPITPGFEVAGVVTAKGNEVVDFEIGDRVMGLTLFGGYASHVVVPSKQLFRLPDALSFEQGAAIPAVFLTAWFALYELAHPRAGTTALVHSAAGGVGSSLVQVLKLRGVYVIGVVGSSHKVESVRALGADHVIDKSTQNLWAEAERLSPGGFDLVLDANGVETLKQSYDHLRPAGKLVVYGFHSMMSKGGGSGGANWFKLISGFLRTPRFSPLDMTNSSKSVLAFNLSYLYDRFDMLQEGMQDISAWLAAGKIVPPAVTSYPIERAGDAHRDIESGKTIGKLVLTM